MTPADRHIPRVRRGAYLLPSAFTIGNMLLGFYAVVLGIRGAFQGVPKGQVEAARAVNARRPLDAGPTFDEWSAAWQTAATALDTLR